MAANVEALQNAINRFARPAGFSPIAVDGGMGPNTAAALLKAIGWVAKGSCYDGVCVADETEASAHALISAIVTDSGAIDQTKIMQSNVGFTTFLNGVASTIGLPMVTGPARAPTNYAANAATTVALNPFAPPGSASVFDSFKKLTTFQKVLVGALAGLGLIWLSKKLHHRTALAGFSSPWLRDEQSGQLVRPATAHEVAWYKHKGRVDLPNPAKAGGGLRRYSVIDA
jgi:hypothetical protein